MQQTKHQPQQQAITCLESGIEANVLWSRQLRFESLYDGLSLAFATRPFEWVATQNCSAFRTCSRSSPTAHSHSLAQAAFSTARWYTGTRRIFSRQSGSTKLKGRKVWIEQGECHTHKYLETWCWYHILSYKFVLAQWHWNKYLNYRRHNWLKMLDTAFWVLFYFPTLASLL